MIEPLGLGAGLVAGGDLFVGTGEDADGIGDVGAGGVGRGRVPEHPQDVVLGVVPEVVVGAVDAHDPFGRAVALGLQAQLFAEHRLAGQVVGGDDVERGGGGVLHVVAVGGVRGGHRDEGVVGQLPIG